MKNPLCKYKDIFGVPGKGDDYRIYGIRVKDVVILFIESYLISWYFKWSFWYTLLGIFILGIIVHRLFCVRTTIDRLLFPSSE